MGKRFIIIFFLSFSLSVHAQTVRIACIGNSITYGSGLTPREKNAYPGQLQSMLGDGYEVMNFGVSGTTLLRSGNKPYWLTPEYRKALQSKPDIVFIKLGTNDSKLINRKFYSEFETDYSNLVDSFRLLPAHPRVILLLPVVSFVKDSSQIFDPVITNEIIPRIRKVAYEKKCELIDLHPLFLDKAWMIPDEIHPSSVGATLIAQRLYEALQLKENSFDIFSKIKEDKKLSSFYGFECADFVFNNRNCKIVKPKKTVTGLPWIWRARFWGHEPQTDIALLERGFHIVYCNVAELYGNKESVDLWNSCYKKMINAGLAKKPVLEGMSRGGVYVYNWAAANPGKVACVYADAPVLDMKSWPGGKGKSKGSAEDWEIFKKDYNYNNEEEAMSFKGNPLDKVAEIVKGKFPMLHVVGDADDVVPVDENTTLFENKIKASGGDITVIHKPGVGHHPHSLANPERIVNFILRATGYKINFAAIATPGAEYRSESAGWKKGTTWYDQANDIQQTLDSVSKLDILFMGNSITMAIGKRKLVNAHAGEKYFDSVFAGYRYAVAGISGDRVQNLIWRVENGRYKKSNPKVVVLTIGVNNFQDDCTPQEIAAGIKKLVKAVKTKIPASKILLVGPLPTGTEANSEQRKKYNEVYAKLGSVQNDKNIFFFKYAQQMIAADGKLNSNYFSGDGIHLQAGGYEKWAALVYQQMIEAKLLQ